VLKGSLGMFIQLGSSGLGKCRTIPDRPVRFYFTAGRCLFNRDYDLFHNLGVKLILLNMYIFEKILFITSICLSAPEISIGSGNRQVGGCIALIN
jgi:hypothetical protein